MNLEIITPEKQLFNGEVTSVKFPGTTGEFEILNNHAPLVSALKSGNIKIHSLNKGDTEITIKGGFVEVLNNELSALVEE